MDRNEQAKFINDLLEGMRRRLMKDIDAGRIPADWDGIELRWLIANRAQENTLSTSKGRKREFNNTVLVNDL